MQVLGNVEKFKEKEQWYLAAREREGRIYTDVELRRLPEISPKHQYYNEWLYRKGSYDRLLRYLNSRFSKGNRNVSIMDLGCGNGWMSNRLHSNGYDVTAVDLNKMELEQAERVFGTSDKLQWVYADIFEDELDMKFDIIILAASCQYFQDISQLTQRLLSLLHDRGEIHLIDSMFYEDSALASAVERSKEYYTQLGFPEMSKYYHHHSKKQITDLGYRVMPKSFLSNILQRKPQLEWWVLRNF